MEAMDLMCAEPMLNLINGQVYLNNEFKQVDLFIDDLGITYFNQRNKDAETIDCKGLSIIPGFIDPHVHLREPGNFHRETFLTGTAAAANSGTTTIIEHPVSFPPPFDVEHLNRRINNAKNNILVDVAFLGAAGGDNINEICKLQYTGNIVGFNSILYPAPPGREKEFFGLSLFHDGKIIEVIREMGKMNLSWGFHAENHESGYQNPHIIENEPDFEICQRIGSRCRYCPGGK
jgi:dihydropyrimidinase/allantoinase